MLNILPIILMYMILLNLSQLENICIVPCKLEESNVFCVDGKMSTRINI